MIDKYDIEALDLAGLSHIADYIDNIQAENERLRGALIMAIACHTGTDEIWLDEARAAVKGETE